jgi:predicted enzyme related to lactoylglutathione lyase
MMANAPSAHFSFTKLLVNDLDKTAAFYKSVCGLVEMARVTDTIAERQIDEILFNATGEGGATFVLLKFSGAPKPSKDEVIVGFLTTDLEAFVQRACAAGGSVVQGIREVPAHGVKVAFIADIEGHLLEVVQML